ncbi:hypothetical protein ACE1CI_36850 [Aerosakkonemataceae cyanobacterium BLCC-F50]|uniref:Uncharacterized protein n=1 Tax=Floridaenema flaviceps BLCC-F50 TaxID=3153642 RepID=A0ABV4Y509_9CYAN
MSQKIEHLCRYYCLPKNPASRRKITRNCETKLKRRPRNVWLTLERS